MKRKVACLLCLAICFSAGCKKNGSADPSGSQGSDSSAEVSDSAKEDPSSLSEDPTTSETVTEVPEVNVKIEKDLAYLPVEVVPKEDYFYPRELTDEDFVQDEEGDLVSIVPGAGYTIDKLQIEGEKYAKIQEMLDAFQGPLIEKTLEDYDQKCKELKELDESSYPDTEGEYFEFDIDLHRADTKVITFGYYLRPKMDTEDVAFSGGVDKVVNISAETGKVLTLSDVVTDKALFEKVLSEEIRYDEYMDITDDVKKACEQTRHDLIENDELEFRLFYDRIEVRMKQDAEYYENPDIFSIPVYKYPEVFNLDLFEHVPEYYTITADPQQPVYWDIDGDGKLDVVQKTSVSGEDTGNEQDFILSINDNELTYKTCSWFGYSFIQADDGRYLYLVVDNGVDCARINDDLSMEIIEKNVSFPMDGWEIPTCQDPSHFTKLETMNFLGLRQMFRYLTVLGVNGIPQATSDYYDEYSFRDTSKVELPAVLFDMETKMKGKETKIPKGSTYELVEYDKDENQALFKITPPNVKDHENDYYAWVEYILNAPESEYAVPMGDIGGIKETDVFDNIAYGG
ncbi:MAG: hypothetical protein K6A81_09615 [Clostridiales bacterium]|nr:hypothetical protein [Clostridiales bacterium]